MSHEQNMHHHLIYLANAKHITSSHYTLHSVLTNMQMIETQYMSLAPANRPQAPLQQCGKCGFGLEHLHHLSLRYMTNGTSTTFFHNPKSFCDECIIIQFCYSKRTCGQPLPSLPV